MLDLPPNRFMAIARVSCASREIEPYDMAPVLNRLTMSATDSTSSIGIGWRPSLNLSRPRSVISRFDCSSIEAVYCLKMS